MDGLGRLFGEVFGEVFEIAGERGGEAVFHAAAEGVGEGMRPEPAGDGVTRYLAGGPRTLNINDR
ncbi:MAG TPA: hypothetical protein VMA36_08675 [Candidatus Limnocylindria bacterium]|jgi:hypothetical protein|nr:hypothetical protein [Candidatus Limnocylindria bacterium]